MARAKENYSTKTAKRLDKLRLRDGPGCYYCERVCDFTTRHEYDSATVEHVKRAIDGGTRELDNIVVACRLCNSMRSARDPLDWRAMRTLEHAKTACGISELRHIF